MKKCIIGVGTNQPVEVRKIRNGKCDIQLLIPEFINYPLLKQNEL